MTCCYPAAASVNQAHASNRSQAEIPARYGPQVPRRAADRTIFARCDAVCQVRRRSGAERGPWFFSSGKGAVAGNESPCADRRTQRPSTEPQAASRRLSACACQRQGHYLTDARPHRGRSRASVVMRKPAGGDALSWKLLGVHLAHMEMQTRGLDPDEPLVLNCVCSADILPTLTAPAKPAQTPAPTLGVPRQWRAGYCA